MSMFRAKKLDITGYVNIRVIRDHTKRKVFEQHEAERYAPLPGDASSRQSHGRRKRRIVVYQPRNAGS